MSTTQARVPGSTLTAAPPRPARWAPIADTHTRTIAKSLSWRFFAFILTAVIAWVVTGSPAIAASIGLADTLVKLVTYYLHERIWLRIRFGQPKQPEYDI